MEGLWQHKRLLVALEQEGQVLLKQTRLNQPLGETYLTKNLKAHEQEKIQHLSLFDDL